MKYLRWFALFSLFVPSIIFAQEVLFEDEFEGDLTGWEINAFGQIVTDPLDSANLALSFSNTNAAGDLFSPPIVLDMAANYIFTFKYLGNAGGAETGGYLWLFDSTSPYPGGGGVVAWSTQPVGVDSSDHELSDDGQWHTYLLEFTPSDVFDQPVSSVRIAVEDWSGAASATPPPNIAGDALFDDIRLYEFGAVADVAASWGEIKALYR